jgi:nitric oxide reductase subunit B
MGSVLTYLHVYSNQVNKTSILLKIILVDFILTIVSILISYLFGQFGGREYWEFNPLFALPILLGWILFIIHFFKTIPSLKNQPVFVWMWLTGLLFFLFTFLESYLWLFPYFRNNIINEMTIQWKSYGSMVGAWNMLVYGCSLFLMGKMSGDKNYGYSRIAFILYFTGLTNLMFNWGHHIYTLPTHPYIQHISYLVSMTELFIFGKIIFDWKKTYLSAKQLIHHASYPFILAADFWIFLSLILAIAMSVPAINLYTHGTHITVAHAMGTTIGINSFLLIAFAIDIFTLDQITPIQKNKYFKYGFWITNISLLLFWISLIGAGIRKSIWQMSIHPMPFSSMMLSLKPFFIVFALAGFSLLIGFICIILPLLKHRLKTNTND